MPCGTSWSRNTSEIGMHPGKAMFTYLTLCCHLPFALSLGGDSPASPLALLVRQTLTSGQWEVPRSQRARRERAMGFFSCSVSSFSVLEFLFWSFWWELNCGSSTSSAPLHLGNGKDLTVTILGRPHCTSSFWPILPIHLQHIISW